MTYAIKLHGVLRARAHTAHDAAVIAVALSSEYDAVIYVHHRRQHVSVHAGLQWPVECRAELASMTSAIFSMCTQGE